MRILSLILCSISTLMVSYSQDVLFTQFYAVPTYSNPAYTGMFEGNYRFSAVYRNQWHNILNDSYRSFTGALDMRMSPQFSENDKIGIGLTFFGDQNGEVPVRQNRFMFQGAYHKALGYNAKNVLSAGFYFGPAQRNVSFSHLIFNDQLIAGGAQNPTMEPLPLNNVSFADLGVGLAFTTRNDNFEGGIGLSASHLNKPNQSQYQDEEEPAIFPWSPSYLLQFWGEFTLVPGQLWITPRSAIYMQKEIQVYQPGAYVSLDMGRSNDRLYLGLNSRMGNAYDQPFDLYDVGLLFGVELSTLRLGVSYDLNLNIQNTFAQQQGTFEVSLLYIGNTLDAPKRAKPTF